MPIPRSPLAVATLVLAAACTEPPPPPTDGVAKQVPVDDPGSPPVDETGGLPAVCKTITVKGKVFYNDLRKYGRFADRKTIFPTIAGTADPYATSNDKQNYLGLYDGKVSLFEIDQAYIGATSTCAATNFVGSTQIAADGTWQWTGSICDSCRADYDGANDNGISIGAKIVLENCASPSTRCFSVDDPQGEGTTDHYTDTSNWGTTWARWYHDATNLAPVAVHQQTIVDLGVDYFQNSYGLTPGVSTDLAAQAANVFASMVDATRQVHLAHDLPFDHDAWGQIRAYFPGVTGGTAHSHQADRLCEMAPATWVSGAVTAHEYGHLTHYWAWGGLGKWTDLEFDSDGDGVTSDDLAYDGDSREYTIAAFKEGWAEFVRRVTFDGANVGLSCASIENRSLVAPEFELFDGTPVCSASAATCTQGRHIIEDVEQVLCDLWDPADANPTLGVSDDRLALSLVDLQDNLASVMANASADEQLDVIFATGFTPSTGADAPLGICRFAEELVAGGVSESLLVETLASDFLDCNL
jgi:hypothetical protein